MRIEKDSTILILSHFYKRTSRGGGPPQDIRDYFLKRTKLIYYIEHPFPSADDKRSSLTVYENGKIIKQIFSPKLFGPQIFYYIAHVLITIFFLNISKKTFDVCIALDNLNTFSVLPYKKLGKIKKLIFYTIDYIPQRFSNKILNAVYHWIDKIACYHSDAIWILSEVMKEERTKNNINPQKSAPSVLLPMGAHLSRINILPIQKINKFNLVYLGSLIEKQGVQIILEALPMIIKKFPKVKLIIIGDGEYKEKLKQKIKLLNLHKYVTFKGFLETHEEVEKILCKSGIGLAPYVDDKYNYALYTDPSKPKIYLGCGLPVIITPVPPIAKIIHEKKAGIMTTYSKESIAKAIITLLSNENLYEKYRENAIKLSKEYDTDFLIERAIKNTR